MNARRRLDDVLLAVALAGIVAALCLALAAVLPHEIFLPRPR